MKIKVLLLSAFVTLFFVGCGADTTITNETAYDTHDEAPADDGSYISLVNGIGIDVDAKYNFYNSDATISDIFWGSYSFCGFQREVEFVSETDEVLVLSGYIQDDYFISTEPHNVNYYKTDGGIDYAALPEGTEVRVKPIYQLRDDDIFAATLTARYTVNEPIEVDGMKLDYHVEYIELNPENVTAIELSPEGYTFSSDCEYSGDATFTLTDGRKAIGTISFFYIPAVEDPDDYEYWLSREIYWYPSGSHEILVDIVE